MYKTLAAFAVLAMALSTMATTCKKGEEAPAEQPAADAPAEGGDAAAPAEGGEAAPAEGEGGH